MIEKERFLGKLQLHHDVTEFRVYTDHRYNTNSIPFRTQTDSIHHENIILQKRLGISLLELKDARFYFSTGEICERCVLLSVSCEEGDSKFKTLLREISSSTKSHETEVLARLSAAFLQLQEKFDTQREKMLGLEVELFDLRVKLESGCRNEACEIERDVLLCAVERAQIRLAEYEKRDSESKIELDCWDEDLLRENERLKKEITDLQTKLARSNASLRYSTELAAKKPSAIKQDVVASDVVC